MTNIEYVSTGFLLGCVFSWATAMLAIYFYKTEVKP